MFDPKANNCIRMRMLHYFHVLAEELHFGRAASRLNITQPPLSIQIKELEEILGVSLFSRSSRSVELTHAGQVLKVEVERILTVTQSSLNYVRQIGRLENQHINIGIVGSALWGPLLARMKRFRAAHPTVNWTLRELSQQQQIEALRARTIDIAINRNVLPEPDMDVRCQLIVHETVRIAIHEDSPLCRHKTLPLAELADLPFISLSLNRSDFARQILDNCRSHGVTLNLVHQVDEPQTALALVSIGNGFALLPESCALIHWPGVIFLPLQTVIPADLYVQWHDAPPPALLSDFLVALKE